MNLISKKDLLACTGISYGQLYRWKRQNLIPEQWFIKQSSYTGQETFFPREQILSRVQSILELKDRYSIDDLAKIFSPKNTSAQVSREQLFTIDELSDDLLEALPRICPKDSYEFGDVVWIAAVSQAQQSLSLSPQCAADLLHKGFQLLSFAKGPDLSLVIFTCAGQYHLALCGSSFPVVFDSDVQVQTAISLDETADIIKCKYNTIFSLK